jgi:hypothetical protein
VKVDIVFEPLNQKPEFFRYLLYSYGGFSVMLTSCSMKYA